MQTALEFILNRAGDPNWGKDEALAFISAAERRIQKSHPDMLGRDTLVKAHEDLCHEIASKPLPLKCT
jgi:hypothetical protein